MRSGGPELAVGASAVADPIAGRHERFCLDHAPLLRIETKVLLANAPHEPVKRHQKRARRLVIARRLGLLEEPLDDRLRPRLVQRLLEVREDLLPGSGLRVDLPFVGEGRERPGAVEPGQFFEEPVVAGSDVLLHEHW